MTTKTIKVVTAWMTEDSDGLTDIRTLSFSGGRGGVRVYDKDRIDGRATIGQSEVPYFGPLYEHGTEAITWMAAHRGDTCQLDVRLALGLGFSFREMNTYGDLDEALL